MTQLAMSSKSLTAFCIVLISPRWMFLFQKCFIKAALFLHKRMASLFIYLLLPSKDFVQMITIVWKKQKKQKHNHTSGMLSWKLNWQRFGVFPCSPPTPTGLHWRGGREEVTIWRVRKEGANTRGTTKNYFKLQIPDSVKVNANEASS